MPEPELLNVADFVSNPEALYETLVSEVAWEEHIKARKTASFGECGQANAPAAGSGR